MCHHLGASISFDWRQFGFKLVVFFVSVFGINSHKVLEQIQTVSGGKISGQDGPGLTVVGIKTISQNNKLQMQL